MLLIILSERQENTVGAELSLLGYGTNKARKIDKLANYWALEAGVLTVFGS